MCALEGKVLAGQKPKVFCRGMTRAEQRTLCVSMKDPVCVAEAGAVTQVWKARVTSELDDTIVTF